MSNNIENFKNYLKLRYKAKFNDHNSGDPIIDSRHFCNIKREWDKVSKYIIDKCINNPNLTLADKIKNIFLARIHNRVETLDAIGYPKKKYNIKEKDLPYKQNPHAYRVQKLLQRLQSDYKWEGTEWEVANHLDEIFAGVEDYTWNDSFELTFRNFCNILKLYDQSFIAYQFALDMDYLFYYRDIDEFVIIGPGAIRGLNMIYYAELFDGVNKEEFTQRIKGVDYLEDLKKLRDEVNNDFEEENIHLHLNDIEFNLCEYCKWYSLSNGIKTTQRRH